MRRNWGSSIAAVVVITSGSELACESSVEPPAASAAGTGGGAVVASSTGGGIIASAGGSGGTGAGGEGGAPPCLAPASAPPELWAIRFGRPNDDEQWDSRGWRVAARPGGGAVLTGGFGGVVSFGNETFDAQGGRRVFVLALDAQGAIEWVRVFGTQAPSSLAVNDVAMDDSGIAIVGQVDQPVDFGTGVLTPVGIDAFFVKLDASGNTSWSELWSDTSDDSALAVAFFANSDLIFTASYDPSDPGYPVSSFAAGWEAAGTYVPWNMYSPGGGTWTTVAVAPTGQAVIAGHFTDLWPFTAELSAGLHDIGVILLSGTPPSYYTSKRYGYIGDERMSALSVSANGIVITGSFTDTTNFGTGAIASQGGEDVFVAQLSSQLEPIWAVGFGGNGTDHVAAVGRRSDGHVWLAGSFVGTASFGGAPFMARGQDLFMALLNGSGQPVWSFAVGGPEGDVMWDAATGENDDAFLTGTFRGCIDFGGGPLLTEGQSDVFVAKIGL